MTNIISLQMLDVTTLSTKLPNVKVVYKYFLKQEKINLIDKIITLAVRENQDNL